jgi:hypothetical protein
VPLNPSPPPCRSYLTRLAGGELLPKLPAPLVAGTLKGDWQAITDQAG